jgi:HK97 family phage major capsid protein
MEFIRRLEARRAQLVEQRDAILEAAEQEQRDALSDEETTRFDALRDEIREVDERLTVLREELARDEEAAEQASRHQRSGTDDEREERRQRIEVGEEPATYGRRSGNSFFLDIARASLRGDSEARQRLSRHGREQAAELERREKRARDRVLEGLSERELEHVQLERRALEPEGAGGDFVPPLYLIDEYADLPRNGRVIADAVNNRPLPGGTDSISLPRVTSGSTVTAQGRSGDPAVNQPISNTQMDDDLVTAAVRTIAGEQDVAQQLLDQSPIAFDEVVFADLRAEYDAELDRQCIAGVTGQRELLGILNVAGIGSVTYTDANPSMRRLYPKLAESINNVAENRKLPPTHQFFHSRRWFWAASNLDGDGRPYVVPTAGGPMNAQGVQQMLNAEGPVGQALGVGIWMDQNIPTGLGSGDDEDRIITVRAADLWLWEGSLRARVLPATGTPSQRSLHVTMQLWNYAAFMPHRRPNAISVIAGTGLVAPVFDGAPEPVVGD